MKCLGDYVTLQRGNSYKSSLLDQPGPVLLGLASIQPDGGFRDVALRSYGGPTSEKIILRPGDIYVSLKDVTQSGDLLGSVSRVPSKIPEGRLTQDTVKLVFKNMEISKDYIYWLLRTPQYRSYCRARATGTTNLGLSREDFLAFPVPEITPKINALVNILDTIEKKIVINRKMNQTLETMAQTIFQDWIINFNPVRAKKDNKKPIGIDEKTAAIFPNSYDVVGEREVPLEWKIESLDNIALFLNGIALQKFPSTSTEFLPVIKIAQLRKGNTNGSDRASITIPSEYIVEDGDVLFSWSGSLEVVIWCGGRGALNQHLFKVTSKKYPKWFYYFWLRHHLPDFQSIAEGKATTMGHIQRHHLSEAVVLIPSSKIIEAMDKIMAPILEKIIKNNIESRILLSTSNMMLSGILPEDFQFIEGLSV